MKILKILKIIVIGAVITFGMIACSTFGAPKEMDEEALALKETLEKATWEITAMSKNRPIFNNNDFIFIKADKIEIAAFQNITVTKNMELGKWYALSAPEIPGTFYYYSKYDSGSLILGIQHNLYKSTTIDEETFASRTAFFNATWQTRAMSSQPSTSGLEKLSQFSIEAVYFESLLNLLPEESKYDTWHSFTSLEMPGIIYYYFENTPKLVRIGETKIIYKGRQ